MSKLGERLQQRLAETGISQADLARQIGVTQPAINHMIKRGTGKTAHLHSIARALSTSPEFLLGEVDDPAPAAVGDDRLPFGSFPVGIVSPSMVDIPQIDLQFGLGGAFMDTEIVEHQAEMRSFPRDWLRMITNTDPKHLCWVQGQGDSMEPVISDGDLALVDRSVVTPGVGDVYWVIAYGQIGMIKRLRPMPDGSVKILSNNPAVPPETAYDGELHIFGRVRAVVKRV